MNIPELIKEAHENAVERGFYECQQCEGVGWGYFSIEEPDYDDLCLTCSGSGIDPNKNIGELLMLIVSELGEALEADRKNHHCRIFAVENYLSGNVGCGGDKNRYFENCIKNSFEDEIADVFIRLFDLCGYIDYELEVLPQKYMISKGNVGEQLLIITRYAADNNLICLFNASLQFCNFHNIPIEKYIEAKMDYNRTRPHKHGKNY